MSVVLEQVQELVALKLVVLVRVRVQEQVQVLALEQELVAELVAVQVAE